MSKTSSGLIYFILIAALLVTILFASAFYVESSRVNSDLKAENQLYKTILKMETEFSGLSIDSQKADGYYNEASLSYENKDYNSVESNCRLARDYYSSESQGYRNMKSELASYNISNKLIEIYQQELDEWIIISNSMYESCEHFESAARYYDTYFNTGVLYDDQSYTMGTGEIDMMNEKINAHDIAVGKLNQLIEDFKVELENRIK